MTTSVKTKIQVVNHVLNSVGERALGSSANQIGTIVVDCIQQAIYDIATSGTWQEFRYVITGTWSADQATLDDTVYRINSVNWYSSPNGLPATSYDYARYAVEFVSLEEYLTYPLYPYTNSALAYPKYWTIIDHNIVRVNPYPNDATEKAKITFDVYKPVSMPISDSAGFGCSDFMLNLIQAKATSLFAMKYTGDPVATKMWDDEYEKLRRKMLVYSTGLPSGGYSMYKGRRGR